MASGHVNRTQRPNTWLHRPSLRREDSPCQLGAVHTCEPRLKGRTHGCTDQACDVKIFLANLEPSTHGPKRHFAASQQLGRFRSEADWAGFMSNSLTRTCTRYSAMFEMLKATENVVG